MYILKISDSIHFKGSLINCLLNGYGLDDFVILNHKGFIFTFHHEGVGANDYEENSNYDTHFMYDVNRILTTKELDKFKIKFRSYFKS